MLRSRLAILLLGMIPAFAPVSQAAGREPDPAKEQQAVKAYGQLPLSFIANQGEYAPEVAFETRAGAYSISLTRRDAVLSLNRPSYHSARTPSQKLPPARTGESPASADIHMRFVGAVDDAPVSGVDELPGKVNYVIGKDASQWHNGVPAYAKVKYSALYPGIDLVYYGNQKRLEFDLIVHPGADASTVKLAFGDNAAKSQMRLRISPAGDLLVGPDGKEIVLPRPVVYQLTGDASLPSRRQAIDASYVITKAHEVRFRLGAYDKSKPLVIDPTVAYSTFVDTDIYGNSAGPIVVDAAGNAYIVTERAIVKMNSIGTALLYTTYFPTDGQSANAMALDAAGDVVVVGRTSYAFPATPGAYQTQPSSKNATDLIYVAKFNPDGTLRYSTYLGNDGDTAASVSLDSAGNAYVAGHSPGGLFPTTPGAYQTKRGPAGTGLPSTAFLTKLNPSGSALVYSTYLGGDDTTAAAVAVDKSGNAYVTGTAGSEPFPTTPGALSTVGGAFLTKFNATGSALLSSTLIQGILFPSAMAIDDQGDAYITGVTCRFYTLCGDNNTVVTTPGAFNPTGNPYDIYSFVMKLNSTGSAYIYSTYLDFATDGYGYAAPPHGIAVDQQGNAFVSGTTSDTGFPVTPDAFQSTYGRRPDLNPALTNAFLVKLNATGSSVLYSTFLHGDGTDTGGGVAVDSQGDAYVAGYTTSGLSFPTTNEAYQSNPAGYSSSFITKFSFATRTGSTSQYITFGFLGDQVYGAAPLTLDATTSSGLPVGFAVTGPATIHGTTLTVLGIGTVTVTASQAGDPTYAPATPVTQTFTVNKKVLAVTADNSIAVTGTPPRLATYQLTGFVHGDTPAVVSGSATVTTTATAASAPGTYPITFATESLLAANYSFAYIPGVVRVIPSQQCQTINNYANGFAAAGLSLNNGATIQGRQLQLTDGGIFEARSVFYQTPVVISTFTTDFKFQLLNPVADGITFTVQVNNPNVHGHSGGDLGYTGIPSSAAVKFDLHANAGIDGDSMGFYHDGVAPTFPDFYLFPFGIDLHSGHIFRAHIAYANAKTAVTVTDTQTGASASQTFAGDLSATVGTGAYVGFTAGTGEETATQNILSWSFAGGPGCKGNAPIK